MASPTTMSEPVSLLEQFHWEPQPEAERVVGNLVAVFLDANEWAAHFARRLKAEAGVRFQDCVDTLVAPARLVPAELLERAGYAREANGADASAYPDAAPTYRNASGIFPTVVVGTDEDVAVQLKVDSVADFAAAHGLNLRTTDAALADVRRAEVDRGRGLSVIERHGYAGTGSPRRPLAQVAAVLKHAEAFRLRPRETGADESAAWDRTEALVDAAVADLGVDYACDLFFAAEREFWERRNRAARVQKARQDGLGIGWANHDHHTYRSSRRHFARLVRVWEKLGLVCRERFYAGREAGWGAQVMEQPNAGIVTFNDVDLSPDELLIDFAHEPLPERHDLGTVGLWCALHGESFLEAGMHHLECTFDFDALKEQLERDHNVAVMKPFTDFPYLKQAFTKGERWAVKEERIVRLLGNGQITPEQADKFRKEGAIGSHLENLERNQGFKGFNQTGVSEIIAATDPRKQSMR